MILPFLLSTFQLGIVNLQIHSEPKVTVLVEAVEKVLKA
jgi:hypothetical protein